MDGTATWSELRAAFRTPLRLLLPKLLKSRNDWKAKSHQRQRQLKAAKVKIRDLTASRDHWRRHTEQLQQDNRHWQQRLEQAERLQRAAQAELQQLKDAQKK